MKKKDELMRILAKELRPLWARLDIDEAALQEVRLRAGCPLALWIGGQEYFVTPEGRLERGVEGAYLIRPEVLRETMEYIGKYSLYAFEEEIRQGFLTIEGGHRVGVAGQVFAREGKVRGIRHISFINIRLSHQVRGCSGPLLPFVFQGGDVCHTLIISPPGCGKTTMLRDLIRQISLGGPGRPGQNVAVVDERSEIAGCYLGIPQNDLGPRTDVLDCCPKAEGMMMAIRSLAPRVVAVDEIGSEGDFAVLAAVWNCGCKILATTHGSCFEDVQKKILFQAMARERVFERYVLLNHQTGKGRIREVWGRDGELLWEAGEGKVLSDDVQGAAV